MNFLCLFSARNQQSFVKSSHYLCEHKHLEMLQVCLLQQHRVDHLIVYYCTGHLQSHTSCPLYAHFLT